MYPDHTATSNPGLRNFLFYFFLIQQLYGVPIFNITMVMLDHSKGEHYHFMTNTPGKFDLYFIFCQLRMAVSVRRSY